MFSWNENLTAGAQETSGERSTVIVKRWAHRPLILRCVRLTLGCRTLGHPKSGAWPAREFAMHSGPAGVSNLHDYW